MLKPFAAREHSKMVEVLLDPQAEGPEIHYYMIRGGSDKTNITVWETGLVGKEYIKTYGHYHIGHLDETYWILAGEGIVALQYRKQDSKGNYINDEIDKFYAISVKEGDEVFIPSGVGHLAINTGKVWFVTKDDSPVNFEEVDPVSLPGHADYKSVQEMKGFAYYIVEKEGKPTAVKNLKYKSIPEIEWLTPTQWKEKLASLS